MSDMNKKTGQKKPRPAKGKAQRMPAAAGKGAKRRTDGIAEERLREIEARYRALTESLDVAVLLMTATTCIECNPATLRLFGLSSKDEIIGKTPLDLAPPKQPDGRNSAELARWNIEQALAKGLHIFEWLSFRKNGEPVHQEVRLTPYRIGGEQHFLCVVIDITERKQAERKLAESQNMLRNVIDAIPVRVFWKDRESRYLGCNNLFAQDAGRPNTDSLLGEDDFNMGWAEQAELYRADDREVMKTGIPKINYEEPQTNPAGDRIWLRTSKIPLRDESGTIYGVLGTYEDITARKRMEEALRESEKMLQTIIDTEPDCIKIIDEESRLIMMNRAGLDMIQADSLDQVKGQFVCPLVAPSTSRPSRT